MPLRCTFTMCMSIIFGRTTKVRTVLEVYFLHVCPTSVRMWSLVEDRGYIEQQVNGFYLTRMDHVDVASMLCVASSKTRTNIDSGPSQ